MLVRHFDLILTLKMNWKQVAPVSWMLVRHFDLILTLKMNWKQVAPVPWVLVLPLFSTNSCDGDVEDEPLSGLVDNRGTTRGTK